MVDCSGLIKTENPSGCLFLLDHYRRIHNTLVWPKGKAMTISSDLHQWELLLMRGDLPSFDKDLLVKCDTD